MWALSLPRLVSSLLVPSGQSDPVTLPLPDLPLFQAFDLVWEQKQLPSPYLWPLAHTSCVLMKLVTCWTWEGAQGLGSARPGCPTPAVIQGHLLHASGPRARAVPSCGGWRVTWGRVRMVRVSGLLWSSHHNTWGRLCVQRSLHFASAVLAGGLLLAQSCPAISPEPDGALAAFPHFGIWIVELQALLPSLPSTAPTAYLPRGDPSSQFPCTWPWHTAGPTQLRLTSSSSFQHSYLVSSLLLPSLAFGAHTSVQTLYSLSSRLEGSLDVKPSQPQAHPQVTAHWGQT